MIGTALKMAAVVAKEVWWKLVLKKACEVAATEGTRTLLSKVGEKRRDTLEKKICRLDKMLKNKQITQIEYDRLRAAVINGGGVKEI
jgi:hypothetical protein